MWIDAGFAHEGENVPGSNFLTLFVSDAHVAEAGLDLAPVGACAQPAPRDLADTLTILAVLLLERRSTHAFERPALDVLLSHVGTVFEPRPSSDTADAAAQRARVILEADPQSAMPVTALAAQVGLSGSELSRRFRRRFRISPVVYRKQLRLVLATRRLLQGGTITEAAQAAGFADAAHLSRTFKDAYGVTPSAWVGRVARAAARR